ncbi:MAG: hypothetical protein LW837_18640, partial [Roseomonas sp.]|nr:hypothetical protein [Roseomonas sp.]
MEISMVVSRRFAMFGVMAFLGSVLIENVAVGQSRGSDREHRMWIVLTFQRPDGREIQMSFNNPAVPRMRLSECQQLLPEVTSGLIDAARQREQFLAGVPLVRRYPSGEPHLPFQVKPLSSVLMDDLKVAHKY